jgi:hypothetical protein
MRSERSPALAVAATSVMMTYILEQTPLGRRTHLDHRFMNAHAGLKRP